MSSANDKVMLATPTGEFLRSGALDGSFSLCSRCDDACIWRWVGASRLVNAHTGTMLGAQPLGAPPAPESSAAAALDAALGAAASRLVPSWTYHLEGLPAGELSTLAYAAREAPGRLPSVHLSELESRGWTVVDNIMSPAMLANLLGNIAEVRSENAEKEARVRASQDRRPYSSNDNVIRPSQLGDGVSFLAKTPVVAQAAMHPVSLWLMESYLKVESLHYCQVPSIGGLRPAEKTGDNAKVLAGGWHSDCASPLRVGRLPDGSLPPCCRRCICRSVPAHERDRVAHFHAWPSGV